LWLPVTHVSGIERQTEPAPQAKKADGPKITVLVVDDDALIAMSTVDMLEDLGHRAIDAGTPARALEILQSAEQVDLLITDYSMPRMNGVELAKAAYQLRPVLPILLATGYAELPAGSSIDLPRIAKPYQQDRLVAAINKILGPGHI
jgi:CheY-like chemotaxis protein